MKTFALNRLRLACGLRWRAARPGLREMAPALRTAALIAFVLIAYGIVGRLDYEIERAAELEARAGRLNERAEVADRMEVRATMAARDVARMEDFMLACLNRDRHWVLGGELWSCEAKSLGPYIPKED